MNQRSLRDRVVEFIAAQTEERDEMLALLTKDELRAFTYQCYQVPLAGRIDPNSLSEPPFPDEQMDRLLGSAVEKICSWMVSRILAERPTKLVEIANQPTKSG